MSSAHPIDLETFLADQLAAASPDLLAMLSTFSQALMGAEANVICGGHGETRARAGQLIHHATGSVTCEQP